MQLTRGTVLLINLNPTKGSETGKIRPIDHKERVVRILGKLSEETMIKIDIALKIIFDLK